MTAINAYISFKRKAKLPEGAKLLIEGALSTGRRFAFGFVPDPLYPLMVMTSEGVNVTVDLSRFVSSVMAAEMADADRWEDLEETRPGQWGNGLYTVHRHQFPGTEMVHLSVHRHDRAPIRDWRHMQKIRTRCAGPSGRLPSCTRPRAGSLTQRTSSTPGAGPTSSPSASGSAKWAPRTSQTPSG